MRINLSNHSRGVSILVLLNIKKKKKLSELTQSNFKFLDVDLTHHCYIHQQVIKDINLF